MGVFCMLLSSAAFTTMAAMVKALGGDLPIAQLIFLRCLLPLPLFYGIIRAKKHPLMVGAKGSLFLRALFGGSAMTCFYYALTHMPLADCIFLGRTQPLFLALLAPFVLGEKTPKAAWFAIATGLAGVLFILQPAFAWPKATWAALTGALLAAFAHLMIRRLNRSEEPLTIVFNFFVLTALGAGIWSSLTGGFVPITARQWLLVAGVALFASLGQFILTMAYRYDRAPAVAAASYSSVILSVVYGYFFWQEIPHSLAWVGGILIICGGIFLVTSRIGRAEAAREKA
ncbi:MAG: DMT family transporter [Proteobacteria bacterium]|nr:DMT family transporter [Pseudomonadota bacterium]MBU1641522.1 DMT family transporter [Pseudomonadota bacterium]